MSERRSSDMFSSRSRACGAEQRLNLGEDQKRGGADLLAAASGVHGVVQRLWSPKLSASVIINLEGKDLVFLINLQGHLRGTQHPFSSFLFFFSQSHTSVNFLLLVIPSPSSAKIKNLFPLLPFQPHTSPEVFFLDVKVSTRLC